MAFSIALACPAESHTLVDRYVVAYGGGFSDHHAHSMVNKEAFAQDGAGMNLNSCEQASPLREQPGHQEQSVIPEPMCNAVCPDRVQAGIAQEHLEARSRRRIAFQ